MRTARENRSPPSAAAWAQLCSGPKQAPREGPQQSLTPMKSCMAIVGASITAALSSSVVVVAQQMTTIEWIPSAQQFQQQQQQRARDTNDASSSSSSSLCTASPVLDCVRFFNLTQFQTGLCLQCVYNAQVTDTRQQECPSCRDCQATAWQYLIHCGEQP